VLLSLQKQPRSLWRRVSGYGRLQTTRDSPKEVHSKHNKTLFPPFAYFGTFYPRPWCNKNVIDGKQGLICDTARKNKVEISHQEGIVPRLGNTALDCYFFPNSVGFCFGIVWKSFDSYHRRGTTNNIPRVCQDQHQSQSVDLYQKKA